MSVALVTLGVRMQALIDLLHPSSSRRSDHRKASANVARSVVRFRILLLLVSAAALTGSPSAGWAQSVWTGSVSDSWFNAGNWSPAAVPTVVGVTIDTVSPNATTLDGTVTLGTNTLIVGQSGTGELSVVSSGLISADSIIIAQQAGSTGTVRVSSSEALPLDAASIAFGAGTGSLQFTGASTVTVTAVISGTGTLIQSGTGTTILQGNHTYTGGTTISAGTLQLGNGVALGLIDGDVTNNSTLVVQTSASNSQVALPGVISGTGQLIKLNPGTLILTGDNTYTGGTTISGGTLRLGDGGATGSIIGDVVDNGFLVFNRSVPTTFTGLISGTGMVGVNALTTVILTANNTYTGVTAVGNGGVLQLGNGGTTGGIVGNIVNQGTVIFSRSNALTYSGVISGTGAVTQLGGSIILTGNSTYTGGTTISHGDLFLGNGGTTGSIVGDVVNNSALRFNRSDTVTFNGVISGTGTLSQRGTGTTLLTAVSTFTGGGSVNAGTLALASGAALSGGGSWFVSAGATLGGYGSVGGPVNVLTGATVAVGNTLPALAGGATGNFSILNTLSNGGVAVIGASGTPVGNTLTTNAYVGGTGSAIRINSVLASDGAASDRLVINGGTATGSSGLTVTNVGGGGALTPGNGILVVSATSGATTLPTSFNLATPAVAGPYNYTLVRGARDGSDLQSWFLRSTLDCALAPTDPACAASGGASNVTPNYRQEVSLYAAVPSMALLYGRALLGTMRQRSGSLGQSPGQAVLFDLQPNGTSNSRALDGGWGRILMQRGSQNGGGVIGGDGPQFSYNAFALQAGTDVYRREGSDGSRDHGGFYAAFGQIDGDVRHFTGVNAGHNTLQGTSLGVYWTHFGTQGWYIDAVAQGTRYDVTSQSSRGLPGLKTYGFGLAASLEGGYPVAIARGWTIEPQAQLIYQRIWLDSASDGAATVSFSDVESLTGRLGARLATSWDMGGADVPAADRRSVTVALRANLWHEFSGRSQAAISSAAGPVPFRANLGGTWAEVGVGVMARHSRSMSFFAEGDYQIGFERSARAFEGRAGVRLAW